MPSRSRSEQIIAVLKFQDGWRLTPGGPVRKSFGASELAVAEAETLVRLARLVGLEVSLLVQTKFGELQAADVAPVASRRRGNPDGAPATPGDMPAAPARGPEEPLSETGILA